MKTPWLWMLGTGLCLVTFTASAQMTLQSGIQWTEDTARVEALKNIEPKINTQAWQARDPQRLANLQAREMNYELKLGNRQVTFFEGGNYAVAYDGEKTVNYYDADGNLRKVSVCSAPFGPTRSYPRRCVEYAYPEGRFITVSLDVSPQESFIFFTDGVLKTHWVGEEASSYDGTRLMRW